MRAHCGPGAVPGFQQDGCQILGKKKIQRKMYPQGPKLESNEVPNPMKKNITT